MKIKTKQSGISLTEAVLAVAVIILLVSVSIPAYKAFDTAISSPAGVQSMVSAALSSARAIAAKNQKYAGIRFQQDKDGNQYMIPIIHDYDATDIAIGYKAIDGKNPVKLPGDICIFDTKNNNNNEINSSGDIDDPSKIDDLTKFSIIFSPSGNLVIKDIRALPGKPDPTVPGKNDDNIFNYSSNTTVDYMFEADRSASDSELSRNSFLVINRKELNEIDLDQIWETLIEDPQNLGQIDNEKVLYINPYTGTIINSE